MQKPIAIIILGPPGGGKDTQARLMSQKLNLEIIETSKIILQNFEQRASDPEIQKEKERFEKGELTDPKLVAQWVMEYINSLDFDKKSGIIFSGSPRTIYEAEVEYPALVEKFGQENIFVIYLRVSEEVAVKRILERAARPLDLDEKVVRHRYEVYEKQTQPVIDFFKEKNLLVEFDGERSIDEIHGDVIQYFKF